MRIKAALAVAIMAVFGLFISERTALSAFYNLDVTSSWTASDFTVSGSPTADPASDGKVFGVAPYDGSTTVRLRVNTASFVSFSAGYTYTYMGNPYTLTHDWYGYTDVTLADSTYSFGTATWDNSGIITSLQGPDNLTAALWTDTDISTGAPTRLSFRMQGTGDGLVADLFIGSRTPTTIATNFLLWEFYGGEEIRSNTYSANVSAVPEPATLLLLGSGLAGLGLVRRRLGRGG